MGDKSAKGTPRGQGRTKTVHWCYPGQERVMARFTLEGDRVTCEFLNAGFEQDIAMHGIFVYDRALLPSDGFEFFDGLERAFANSSFVGIEAS